MEATHTAIVAPVTPTPGPTQTSVEARAPNAPATATPTPTAVGQPGTAHLAVLISECIVPVGGTASSEVFVHLQDVRPGIERMRLVLHFEPQVVHVQDTDKNPANGTQVTLSPFFGGSQIVVENEVDNLRGEIKLALVQAQGTPVEQTASWHKVATVVWIGRQAGNSPLTVSEQSRFTDAEGGVHPPNALNNGTAFARLPGQIKGRVQLQGRTEHGNTTISGTLAATRVDRSYTGLDGSFVLTASHGEGFYTLSASARGYLTAAGSRPIKLTVGSQFELQPMLLLGGDVNGDNWIDIRDLSYVAYHLGAPDAQSDINGDGTVDILDLALIAGNFGTMGPTIWPISD